MPVRDRPECVGDDAFGIDWTLPTFAPTRSIGPAARRSSRSAYVPDRRSRRSDDRSVCRYVLLSHSNVTAYNKTHVSGHTGERRDQFALDGPASRVLVSDIVSCHDRRSYTCRAGTQSARSATHKGRPCIAVGRPGATRLHIQTPQTLAAYVRQLMPPPLLTLPPCLCRPQVHRIAASQR